MQLRSPQYTWLPSTSRPARERPSALKTPPTLLLEHPALLTPSKGNPLESGPSEGRPRLPPAFSAVFLSQLLPQGRPNPNYSDGARDRTCMLSLRQSSQSGLLPHPQSLRKVRSCSVKRADDGAKRRKGKLAGGGRRGCFHSSLGELHIHLSWAPAMQKEDN